MSAPGIQRLQRSKAQRAAQAAPPLVKVVHAADDADGSVVTDVYDLERDPVGGRWQPYTAILLSNYHDTDPLYFELGNTSVPPEPEYQVPAMSQLSLTGQRIAMLAVRRANTVSYRMTLRRDASYQELV